MYLGQNAFFTTISPAERNLVASADVAAMQSAILPSGEMPDCPPFDCSQCPVKVVEKTIPGPTQIIYRDRFLTAPAPAQGTVSPSTGLAQPEDGITALPIVRIPAAPAPAEPFAAPEDTEMSEGVTMMTEEKKFPWLWLALGGGALYFMTKKK